MTLIIDNTTARHLFLERHGLCVQPTDAPLAATQAMVHQLGFVQLDSINAVERAHHLILASRLPDYQREYLAQLHHDDLALFEHWTHDAAIIPMAFYPHWRHQFRRARSRLQRPHWQSHFGPEAPRVIRTVRARIRQEGALRARDFEDKGQGAWWGWGPSKTALEYLWRTGELAIARREGFEKVYDLAERVIPTVIREQRPTPAASRDWFCREALARLGFASPQEIAAFWHHVPIQEVRAWVDRELRRGRLIAVDVEAADKRLHRVIAHANLGQQLDSLRPLPVQARFLSPFDPVIRDRKRAMRLFGFDYRLEVFVPEHRRRYGYYVLPLLERDRFIGRADLKVHRSEGRLVLKGFWPEPLPAPPHALSQRRHSSATFAQAAIQRSLAEALAALSETTGTRAPDPPLVFGT